ncbi:hypothetical protein [Beijerinckia indica]|uniref:Uncharacterized protein n=1 Tax=Beijerinckia indica subsp. indica (strain ATCC 9039 / DSM 1715 / NCIMB 8712) TaxID=395963 RepID=B2ICR4_BEII9|nr:hypothetical protein [Beijerinckia indica]ACB95338.1 hypothetical protein Bind_1708 [Beijerinckia indica subsp. indica ATCC 9039]
MSDAYAIQIAGSTVGIVARDRQDKTFNFFAATREFNALEGCRFLDPIAAEQAARHLRKHGSPPSQRRVQI